MNWQCPLGLQPDPLGGQTAGIQALHPSLRDLSTQGQPTSPVLPTGAQLLAGASYPGQLPSCLLGFTENQRGWGEKGTFTELLLYARHLLTPLHLPRLGLG